MHKKTNFTTFLAVLTAIVLVFCQFPAAGAHFSEDACECPVCSKGLGDVDEDNSVTTSDALLVFRYAMGILSLSEHQLSLADWDGNGEVDTTDALNLFRYSMGLTEHVHQWQAHTTTIHYDAWDEEVSELHYVCATCGDVGTEPPSEDHVYNHMIHGEAANYWERYVVVTIHHDAYDETITYYVCTICGATTDDPGKGH